MAGVPCLYIPDLVICCIQFALVTGAVRDLSVQGTEMLLWREDRMFRLWREAGLPLNLVWDAVFHVLFPMSMWMQLQVQAAGSNVLPPKWDGEPLAHLSCCFL